MSALARQTCCRKRIASDRVRACRGGNLPSRLSYIERIGQRGPVDISKGLRARGVVCEMREGGSEILQQLFIRLLRIGPAGAVSTHAHMYRSWASDGRDAQNTVQRGDAMEARTGGHTGCETSRGSSEQ